MTDGFLASARAVLPGHLSSSKVCSCLKRDPSRVGSQAKGTQRRDHPMSDNIYSVSEIVGSSSQSIDDAIRGAVGRASRTLHNLDWFEVTDLRGRIEDDGRCRCQVTLKVGFRLD